MDRDGKMYRTTGIVHTIKDGVVTENANLMREEISFAQIQRSVDAMALLGVPYGKAVLHAEAMAREQAQNVADSIRSQGGPAGLQTKQIVAMVAYLQRLGTDIRTDLDKGGTP